MTASSIPHWLERVVRTGLGTEPQDTRLGDLSEQYVRTLERNAGLGDAALSRLVARLHYAGSAAIVVLFARVVDPGLRLSEDGTLGRMALELREKLMNAVRRLAMPAVLLACSAFLVFSAVAVWQDWRRNEALLQAQQRDKAEAAAQRIEAFLGEIQRQIGWVAQARWGSLPVEQRRFDYVRVLRQMPPISQLTFIDAEDLEQLNVDRLSMDKVGVGTDRSSDPAVREAKSVGTYFGPVYFRKESEPYLTMAVRHGRSAGVTIAAINLKAVLDGVVQTSVGNTGYAYIVDGKRRLVAHPDIALVLRGTDMQFLPQVAAAFAPTPPNQLITGTNRNGTEVWSAQSPVKTLDWRVFVELPVAETRTAFWLAMARAGGLLALGLAAAWAAFRLGMRPALPLRAATV